MSDVVGPFTRLALRNVRCFRDATIELDPRLTVLIGENGAGKTTAVEALASLASGDGEGLEGFPLARGARGGEIALFDGAGARPAAVWKTGRSGRRRLPEMRHLFAYGRYRRVCFPPDEDNDEAPARRLAPLAPAIELDALAKRARERRTTTLFRPDNHLLRDLSRYLVAPHFAGRADH